MKNMIRAAVLSLLLVAVASAETVKVAAAISLREALTQIAKDYEAPDGPETDHVELIFGASGQLEQQIKNGAPIDAFVSAANRQVDDLIKAGLVDPVTRRIVARNSLVLIVPAGSKVAVTRFRDLLKPEVKRIGVGEPKIVPAGQYAMEVLKSMKLADALEPRIIYGANVRQVLDYVERGEVDAGLVYGTDAKESGDKVRVVATADASTHEPIVYPAVVIKGAPQSEAAERFLTYLTTDPARVAFAARGFSAAPEVITPTTPAPSATTRPATPTTAPGTPGTPGTLRIGGDVAKPLTLNAADIAAMPHATVHGSDHGGADHAYSGVRLDDLLARAGVKLDAKALHGKRLTGYLTVEGADGYRVIFALPELSADFSDRPVILADQRDGKPLPVSDGPFQIIVPGEKRHARWVRQAVSLSVVQTQP